MQKYGYVPGLVSVTEKLDPDIINELSHTLPRLLPLDGIPDVDVWAALSLFTNVI